MATNTLNYKALFPVLFTYVVMGFVDIVGVSTGYAQRDFDLSPETAQLIPSMAVSYTHLTLPTTPYV